MQRTFTLLALTALLYPLHAQRPDTLWVQFDDRFVANEYLPQRDIDSLEFTATGIKQWMTGSTSPVGITKAWRTDARYRLDAPERYLVKPNTYNGNDYANASSQWCYERSRESEHFAIFWEKGLQLQQGGNLTGGASSSVCNVNTLLSQAEKIWQVYVDSLGFLVPGNSTTDKVKIQMYVVNQSEWRADGSGVDGTYWTMGSGNSKTAKSRKTGIFHCNPWAASGNVTVAHEIGHTFQYLVSADLGMSHGLNYVLGEDSSGNEWWEDCANWQAHKVYPAQQFADNWGNNQAMHHLNILHEEARYNNCYYQDWWCQQHGLNTIGRVWRESRRPEDPIQAYMRMFDLNTETFADEQWLGYAHIASMDIDRWQQYGQGLIGSERQRLIEPTEAQLATITALPDPLTADCWVVDPQYCPQNYGYNANPLKVPAAGTEVRVEFRGIAGLTGYRNVRPSDAGWRYGLVACTADGIRTYGEMGRDNSGTVSITVPEGCKYLWLVVMGAPQTYWTHSWNGTADDDEQWPYAVSIQGTDPLGAHRTYGEYPDDYVRRDTTVVIEASLAYSSSNYSAVRVQYDMDAVSRALGLSTAQMQGVLRNTTPGTPGTVVFAGVSATGAMQYNTTTSTSSETCYGHWFSGSGMVCSYGSSAQIFAEFTPEDYTCQVGQYPGRLTVGQTYTIRQAIIYTDSAKKRWRAYMEVHLTIQ